MVNTMFADVEEKQKKKNQLLFSRDSACLQELIRLLGEQTHRTLVLWALGCAALPLAQLEERYPLEPRPRAALEFCAAWARGKIKMPAARQAILAVHTAATELSDPVFSPLCHGIGQAGATVHAGGHAPGLPFYELTSLVRRFPKGGYEAAVLEKINWYKKELLYWRENAADLHLPWAAFLSK